MQIKTKGNNLHQFSLPAHPGGAAGRISKAVFKCLKLIAEINPEAKVGVACSGGADSLVLAATVLALAPRLGLQPVVAIVDHGWRPESAAEAEVVRKRLLALGYQNVKIFKLPNTDSPGSHRNRLGLEGTAREGRYQVLKNWMEAYGKLGKKSFLLLGHTRDDQAETVLLGLARGSGGGSIKGMVKLDKETGYCRPLLDISRQDIEAMCTQYQLIYVKDPSNYLDSHITTKQGTPLLRTALRHRVIPVLSASLGVDVRLPLAKTAKRIQSDEEALNWVVEHYLQELQEESRTIIRQFTGGEIKALPNLPAELIERIADGKVKLLIKTEIFKNMPKSLRNRIWHRLCLLAGSPGGRIKTAQIELIDQLVRCKRSLGPLDLPGKLQVYRVAGKPFIYFYQPS